MKLQMRPVGFTADQKLLDFIQKRADKLETFYDRVVDGEVFLRLDQDPKKNKIVEVKLNIPGSTLFAKEQAASFEAAADDAMEALRRQIKKHKEKLQAKH